jgi:hypothetical protein
VESFCLSRIIQDHFHPPVGHFSTHWASRVNVWLVYDSFHTIREKMANFVAIYLVNTNCDAVSCSPRCYALAIGISTSTNINATAIACGVAAIYCHLPYS